MWLLYFASFNWPSFVTSLGKEWEQLVHWRLICILELCVLSNRWDLITNKSYQSFDPVSATVTTKVKGLGFVQRKNQTQLLDNGFVVNSGSQYKMFDVRMVLVAAWVSSFFKLSFSDF